jgi:hypothetical protein
MSRIILTINQVVLRGFEPADRTALLEALQAELREVLADPAARAWRARSHRTELLNLGSMPFSGGRSAGRDFGTRMARAIGKELKRQ